MDARVSAVPRLEANCDFFRKRLKYQSERCSNLLARFVRPNYFVRSLGNHTKLSGSIRLYQVSAFIDPVRSAPDGSDNSIKLCSKSNCNCTVCSQPRDRSRGKGGEEKFQLTRDESVET